MKTIWTIFLGMFLTINFADAQETLFIYQGGEILYKRVITAVDSITFYNVPLITVTDRDGNVYKTVKIGNQVWMAENLKVTRYRNGESITNLKEDNEWTSATFGAWCDYSNMAENGNKYGHLYNWYAVRDGRNIAPVGWHIPTDPEWTTLKNYLGGESVAGGKLKETGVLNWISPNTGATNETGFTALPGGIRGSTFDSIGILGIWWSSTLFSELSGNVDLRTIYNNSSYFNFNLGSMNTGCSVRCIKDN